MAAVGPGDKSPSIPAYVFACPSLRANVQDHAKNLGVPCRDCPMARLGADREISAFVGLAGCLEYKHQTGSPIHVL